MRKIICTLILCICACSMLHASNDEFKTNYAPEQYDSLIARWHEQHLANTFDTFFNDFIDLDSTTVITSDIPDSVYSARLKMILSPIQLPYNDIIRRYIVTYTTSRKETMRRILGLSQYYFPMIEQELAIQGLPLELRVLPIIESALSATAVSRVGATGLWQFMYGTGKNYGLEISSFVDQRRDPITATKAACRYLKDLYALYNDWTLAIAAYNCGPGNVNKALKRAGTNAKTYWDIYPFLPKETRGYIPSFIAATYAYTFHKQHNMEPYTPPMPLSTDTIVISKLMHLEQISSTLNTPIETLRALNPQYKMDIIPAVDKSYSIILPQNYISKFIEQENEIMAKDTIYLAQYLKPSNLANKQKQFDINSTIYRVKSGDNLGSIARKYGTTVSQLMKWNKLKTTSILRIGQSIEIYQ